MNKHQKFEAIKTALIKHNFPTIARRYLKLIIMQALFISDPHTVNNWVNLLLSMKIISPNPTSERTDKGFLKPSNDTIYIINETN